MEFEDFPSRPKETVLHPLCDRWVDDMVADDGQTPEAIQRADRAHACLLLSWALGPFELQARVIQPLLSALWRQAQAREKGETTTLLLAREVQIARLTWQGNIHLHPLEWAPHTFAFIKSEHTPMEVKLALLEYVATNQGVPDTMEIFPFLMGLIRDETHDKLRACAVFVLVGQFRCKAGNDAKQLGAMKLLTRMWGGTFRAGRHLTEPAGQEEKEEEEADAQVVDGEGDASRDDRAALTAGPLTKAALAFAALRCLTEPPAAAMEHALDVQFDESTVVSAWSSVPGGDAVRPLNLNLSHYGYQPVEQLLPPELMAYASEQLADFLPARSETTVCPLPAAQASGLKVRAREPDTLTFAHMMRVGFGDLNQDWAFHHALPLVVAQLSAEAAKARAAPDLIQRSLCFALRMVQQQPLPEGTLHTDLPEQAVKLLWLLLEPSLAHVWPDSEPDSTSTAATTAKPVRARPVQEQYSHPDYYAVKPPREAPATVVGELQQLKLPQTSNGLRQFLTAPVPAHLIGRKWFVNWAELYVEPWATMRASRGRMADTHVPIDIRGMANNELAIREWSAQALRCEVAGLTEAGPSVVKWLVRLLTFASVPDKHLIVRTVSGCTNETALVAGKDPGFDEDPADLGEEELAGRQRRRQEIEAIIVANMPTFIELLTSGDAPTKRQVLCLLAARPQHWEAHLPLVETVFRRRHPQPEEQSVRASALSALAVLAPVDQPLINSASELACAKRVVQFLCSFLPLPSGEIAPLRDLAAARLVKEETDGKMHDNLPEELQALLADKAAVLANDPADFRFLQQAAAVGLCRLLCRLRGVVQFPRCSDGEMCDIQGREEGRLFKEKAQTANIELEQELGLARFLPSLQQVVVANMVEPQPGPSELEPLLSLDHVSYNHVVLLELFGPEAALAVNQARGWFYF